MQINQIFVGEPAQTKEPKAAMRNLRLQGEHRRQCSVSSSSSSTSSVAGGGVNIDQHPLVAVCRRDGRHDDKLGDGDAVSSSIRYTLTRDGVVRKEGLVDNNNNKNKNNGIIWELKLSQVLDIADRNDTAGWFDLVVLHNDHDDDNERLVALSHGGAIASIVNGVAELVGEFENGLVTAAWSPHNREFLALITFVTDDDNGNGDGTVALSQPPQPPQRRSVLLTMNSQFDVLEEATIELLASSHDDKEDEKNDDSDTATTLCWSPSSVTPAQIAISSVDAACDDDASTRRKVRFYAADSLTLLAVGRTEDGSGTLAPHLQGRTLAWNNQSALLAAVQRKGKRTIQVSFFEPNGLRHREFALRGEKNQDVIHVQSLAWNNPVGDLLAVTLRCQNSSSDGKDLLMMTKVQLWHRSNYHWYLKYELRYNHEQQQQQQQPVQSVYFDEMDPYRLFIVHATGWNEYVFQWDDSTTTVAAHGGGAALAFSVDGTSLNMTDLDRCFMPPPMYASTLQMDAPVCALALSSSSTSLTAAGIVGVAILANGSCAVLGRQGRTTTALADVVALTPPVDDSAMMFPSQSRSPCLLSCAADSVLISCVTCADNDPLRDEFVIYRIHWSQQPQDESSSSAAPAIMTRVGSILLDGRCLAAVPWTDDGGGVLIQLDDGTLWEYEPGAGGSAGAGTVLPSTIPPLMEPCPWMAAIKNPSAFGVAHRDRLMVGKSRKNRLYCHELLLADSISSFAISIENGYLCYVTSDTRCICRFLPLIDLCSFDPLLGADENHLLEGYEPRMVEEGARLVAVLTTKPAMVLQMPRGNLDVNYPRALVLRHVMMDIKNGRYRLAYETMRRLKVDFNLIVDMDPVRFLHGGGVVEFLDQVVAIDHLNLFISTLQNWNSTAEQIPVPHWIQPVDGAPAASKQGFDFSTKVNQVCTALRELMLDAQARKKCNGGREVASSYYLLPVLSTFAKHDPPQLADALALIRHNAENQASSDPDQRVTPLLSIEAQDSIKYLAFLADYELLFNTALGMYDYEMARAVARNSQMDPKTYLPLLRRYMELPSFFAKYEVDIKLERYDAALRNLAASGDAGEHVAPTTTTAEGPSLPNSFECCMALVESRGLHALGLKLFKETAQRRQILLSLGNHAMGEKKYELALAVFLSARDNDIMDNKLCIEAAKMAKDWRTLFSLAASTEHESLAREMAETLAASAEGSLEKRTLLHDAARILLDYGHHVGRAIELLTSAKLWDEARRVALLDGKTDLSGDVIESAVTYAYTCIEDFREREVAFEAATKRFGHSIRIRKEATRNGDEEMMLDEGAMMEQSSQFSMASNASMMSTRSTSSRASAASLSSVISVKSNSSFSVTRDNRHKSKFNSSSKKKNERKKGKKRVAPGSDEDLNATVDLLKGNLIGDEYRNGVDETIAFLLKSDQQSSARALYDGYLNLCRRVREIRDHGSQQRREETFQQQNGLEGLRGDWNDPLGLDHPTESVVATMDCPPLSDFLQAFFFTVPAAVAPINPY
jgi:elongator complex protein 1